MIPIKISLDISSYLMYHYLLNVSYFKKRKVSIMEQKTTFCQTCNDEVIIELENTTFECDFKGDHYIYEGIEPNTPCGHVISDKEIQEYNRKALHDTYREHNHIIELKKIRELPEKYDIGKRPLSHLLQWGELTFTRYFDGDIPSKAYSDVLVQIYNHPEKYLHILEQNKDFISNKTYEKSKTAVLPLLKETSKITEAYQYIFLHCEDISPLSAQKILYYAQGFFSAFFEQPFLEEVCFAGEQGPIYLDLSQLPPPSPKNTEEKRLLLSESPPFTVNETLVLDCVISHFGCFSGKFLTYTTQHEPPWYTARSGMPKGSTDLPPMPWKKIQSYFLKILEQENMINPLDLKRYPQKLYHTISP